MICPWAGGAVRYQPGQEGSRAGMGDSIVLGCGHTWGIWFNRGPVPGMRRGTACWGDRCRTDYGVRSHRSSIKRVPSRVLPKSAGRCIAGMMEPHDCGASQSRGPRGPACPPPATAGWSPTHPPKRLSDRANRKNGRPYGPLWAFRRMSGGVPDTEEIGIGPFPSRGGLGKGPLNETLRLCRR